MKKKAKKLTAVILVIVTIFLMISAEAIPAGAAVVNDRSSVSGTEADYVYFKNEQNWGSLRAYFWSDENEDMMEWPGTAMESLGENVYRAEIPTGAEYVAFSGRGGQTSDLTLQKNKIYYPTLNEWKNYPEIDYVYFKNEQNWSNLRAYFWSDENEDMMEWPGTSMESLGENVYRAEIPAGAEYVTFSGRGGQTADLTLQCNKIYYPTLNEWRDYPEAEPEPTTVEPTTVEPTTVEPTTVEPTTVEPTTAEPTTAEPTTVTPPTVPAGYITVYFTDALYWGGTINVYYWGGDEMPILWPGNAMTYDHTNYNGEYVYTAYIPADATGVIFNSESYPQTVDITEGIEDGAWWYTNGDMEGYNYKVTKIADPLAETTAESTTATPTVPSDMITVYFTDALYWDGTINVFYWGGEETPDWPGNAMTYDHTNYNGESVYKAYIPQDATGVIFNSNGNPQTVDITAGIEDGAWWYTNGETVFNDFGSTVYMVTKVADPTQETTAPAESTTAEPTTVTPPTAPANYITVYFTDALYWGGTINVFYWGGEEIPDWPGNAMTYDHTNYNGESVYKAYIPQDATGVIFNSNGNPQTVDITAGIEDGAWWYTNGETVFNDFGSTVYMVNKVGDPVIETEPVTEPEGDYVYFKNEVMWTDVSAYFWSDENESMMEWPGNAMENIGNDVYRAVIPTGATYVIFNNRSGGTGNQTEDLTIYRNKIYYPNLGWDDYVSETNIYAVGDVNLDNRIDINDVTAIQRYIANIEQLTADGVAVADTDGDGTVTIADATHLQKFIASCPGIVLG